MCVVDDLQCITRSLALRQGEVQIVRKRGGKDNLQLGAVLGVLIGQRRCLFAGLLGTGRRVRLLGRGLVLVVLPVDAEFGQLVEDVWLSQLITSKV